MTTPRDARGTPRAGPRRPMSAVSLKGCPPSRRNPTSRSRRQALGSPSSTPAGPGQRHHDTCGGHPEFVVGTESLIADHHVVIRGRRQFGSSVQQPKRRPRTRPTRGGRDPSPQRAGPRVHPVTLVVLGGSQILSYVAPAKRRRLGADDPRPMPGDPTRSAPLRSTSLPARSWDPFSRSSPWWRPGGGDALLGPSKSERIRTRWPSLRANVAKRT